MYVCTMYVCTLYVLYMLHVVLTASTDVSDSTGDCSEENTDSMGYRLCSSTVIDHVVTVHVHTYTQYIHVVVPCTYIHTHMHVHVHTCTNLLFMEKGYFIKMGLSQKPKCVF